MVKDVTVIKARRNYVCKRCGGKIPKGSRYVRIATTTPRYHMRCYAPALRKYQKGY